jgi:hypothetical protein
MKKLETHNHPPSTGYISYGLFYVKVTGPGRDGNSIQCYRGKAWSKFACTGTTVAKPYQGFGYPVVEPDSDYQRLGCMTCSWDEERQLERLSGCVSALRAKASAISGGRLCNQKTT